MGWLNSYNIYFPIHQYIKLTRVKSYEEKPNACIIFLVRNRDLKLFKITITNLEMNFNKRYNYPYVLFNDVEFDDHFKKTIKSYTNSSIEFVRVSKKAWEVPSWIDKNRLNESIKNIGFPLSYRQMCRFYSGFFYKENATLKYDMYMRLDVDSNVPCEIKVDPFMMFKNNSKLIYGFAVCSHESFSTIPTIWKTIKEWLKKDENMNKIPKSESILKFISTDNGTSLDRSTMFFNNFEVGRFSLFRSQQYNSYFDHLDRAGGFYYERWGNSLFKFTQ
jgi:alpha 1,2-mannosyltransferase